MTAELENVTRAWQSNPRGRLRNLSLSPSAKNALFPLFEATMNSIHAIEERFGKDDLPKGRILIEALRDDEHWIGFRITDNGIGFTKNNLESFLTMDSQTKAKIGGKGVGRLSWLKVMDSVPIVSTHLEDKFRITRTFQLTIENPLANEVVERTDKPIGTVVELSPYEASYKNQLPVKLETIANRVLAHFISYFINVSHPEIIVTDGSESISLFDEFTSSISRDQDFKKVIEINGADIEFTLHCFLLPKNISDDDKSYNAVFLGANGRAVTRYDFDKVLGMNAIHGRHAFLGYVESDALDDSVNETRTNFSISEEIVSQVIDFCKTSARIFLGPEIQTIRDAQTKTINQIRIDHPRLYKVTQNPESFANSLHLGTQKTEDIYIEMTRRTYRDFRAARTGFRKAVKSDQKDRIEEQAKAYIEQLQDDKVSSLAEYVARRR